MTGREYPFKTIDGCEHFEKVDCEWFTENGEIKHRTFNIEELETVWSKVKRFIY
jgi:hypothetical protein